MRFITLPPNGRYRLYYGLARWDHAEQHVDKCPHDQARLTTPVTVFVFVLSLHLSPIPPERAGCDTTAGRERIPADPEEGYGLEKLFMEKLCQYFREDWELATRVVRFHNVYGPLGTYEGGRESSGGYLP